MKRMMTIIAALLVAVPFCALAQGPTDSNELKELKDCMDRMEQRMDEKNREQDDAIKEFDKRIDRIDTDLTTRYKELQQIGFGGIELSLGGTFIVQGVKNANSSVQDRMNAADPSFSMDFVLNKDFADVDGRGFLHLEAGKGSGVEEDITAYSNVNRDADNVDSFVKLTELYYEQFMLKDRLFINAGFIDPTILYDNVSVANDETRFFLGRMFRNSPTIDFPDNSLGLRVNVIPLEWLELSAAVMNANPEWKDIFSNLFGIGQITFMPKPFGLDGHYRIYSWINGYDYTKWTTGTSGHNGYGFGISVDQKFTDDLTLFARYGWENPKVFSPLVTDFDGTVYTLEQAWSFGMSLNGGWWKRKDDTFAIALGEIFPSREFTSANGFKNDEEIHIETYYSLVINKHIALTPDFQFIKNAFGGNSTLRNRDIYVFGLRMQVDI